MHREDVDVEGVLRRAMRRAGLVTGHVHACRRKGCTHSEAAPDPALRRCPSCGMKLWPKGVVRPLRFHDLRHYPACRVIPRRVVSQQRGRFEPASDAG
jgi:integrase